MKSESFELPVLKPRTHCVLIPRDPYSIFVYWNYTEKDIDQFRRQLEPKGEGAQLILRIYEITNVHFDGKNANQVWDIEVGYSVKNWYIQVDANNAEYCVELGGRGRDHHFMPLVRSNTVRTPPRSASIRKDLIWQDIKFYRESKPFIKGTIKGNKKARTYYLTDKDIHEYYSDLFTSIAPQGEFSAISWQNAQPLITNPDLLQRTYLGSSDQKGDKARSLDQYPGASESQLGAETGASESRLKKREFFFEIATELLVYGRTEPDATVWLNGKEIKLNPDGTFALRYSLPDGNIPFKFIAQSHDGVEQRHISTGVEREKTIGFPKMLRDPNG
jgi:hypothetical protein